MATHSSVLAWRIPEMGEPGGLPFLGSHRVRHDWSDVAAAYSPWGCKESDMTEWLSLHFHFHYVLNHPLHITLLKKLQPKQFVFDMVISQGEKRKASWGICVYFFLITFLLLSHERLGSILPFQGVCILNNIVRWCLLRIWATKSYHLVS